MLAPATRLTNDGVDFMSHRVLAFFYAILTELSFAQAEPIFGFELTFTNTNLRRRVDTFGLEPERHAIADRLLELCPLCQKTELKTQYFSPIRIDFPDGMWITISRDPHVVEVQTKPMNSQAIHAARDQFQMLFDACAHVGLRPHQNTGGGHLNIDYHRSFSSDLHRRNFIVDLFNHPELALGAHEFDLYNARPFVLLSEKAKTSFSRSLAAFDAGYMRFLDFLNNIDKSVYRHPKNPVEYWDRHSSLLHKRMALSFDSVCTKTAEPKSAWRFEIRAVRPQSSVDRMLSDIALYRARIRYLSTFEAPLRLENQTFATTRDLRQHFRRFVEESGLDWNDYTSYPPKDWDKYLKRWGMPCHRHFLFTTKDRDDPKR